MNRKTENRVEWKNGCHEPAERQKTERKRERDRARERERVHVGYYNAVKILFFPVLLSSQSKSVVYVDTHIVIVFRCNAKQCNDG